MRMLTTGFAAVAVLLGTTALTTPAFATGNQCHYNCTPTPPPQGGGDVDIDNNNKNTAIGVGVGVGYGGKGGEGGQGGVGYGGKGGDADATAVNFNANVAKGGNAYNHNDIDNKNTNLNANFNKNEIDVNNKNIQGQAQSLENKNYNQDINNNKNIQGQAQSLENKNYNQDINNNKNIQGQGQGQKQGQDQDQKQGQLQGQAQNVEDSGNSSVNINNERAPVNTAYAAGLSVGEDTCMGSSSFGAQAVSFGLSIGTTWQDDNCRRLKNSRQLVALGYHRAGTALMCVDEDVKNAMIMAGTPCPNGQVAAVYIAPTREYQTMAPVADEPRKIRKRKVRKALPPK